jgi:hypothetical protein
MGGGLYCDISFATTVGKHQRYNCVVGIVKKFSYVVTWSKKLSAWKKSTDPKKPDDVKLQSRVQQIIDSAPQPIWHRVVSDKWNNDHAVKKLVAWLDAVIENPCFVKSRIGPSYDSGVQIWFNNEDDLTAFVLAWDVNILTYRHFAQTDFANHITDWLVDFNRIY